MSFCNCLRMGLQCRIVIHETSKMHDKVNYGLLCLGFKPIVFRPEIFAFTEFCARNIGTVFGIKYLNSMIVSIRALHFCAGTALWAVLYR